jgi:tetratricopeptide (TPR) repeat protein/predicted Ser/Thr protein kinase
LFATLTEPAAACPDEDVLLAFLEGRLGDAQRASAAAHVDGCESCQEVVAAVAPALLSRTSAWGDSPFVRDSALARGATIGRYVILGLVGRGGMGEVYAAYDPELDRKIALKILHASAEGEAEAGRARMLREAKAIARLSHPNVVVVHDAGTVGGRVFIAMEFVDGRTLADWLKESPRDWREVREVFLAAGRALAAAHVAGLVHRDFKPQNVMVGDDGKVRVMDFGLASTTVDGAGDGRHLDLPGGAPLAMERVAGVALTRTGVLLGTPAYMAPEQFRAEPVDPRTDQFSYCVSLHEALHGERPFVGQSVAELALAVTRGDQREPEQRNRAPVWLRRIIQRGLQPERERRWPSMDELLAALERDPGRARRRWLVAAAAVLLLAAGIVGQRVASRAPVALCRGAAARLTGVWEGAGSGATSRRETTRKVFATASPELGADTWRRVSSLLDGYAQKWTALYTTTCEATQLRGEQSVEVMDLKMDCLGQALDGLASLTGVFAEADRGVVIQAIDATLALPELNRCKDVQALRAVVPPPRAKEDRTRVDELRRRNAEAKALLDTGRVDGARRRLPDLLRAAEGSGYAPVVSEVALNAALLSYQIMALDEAEALNERAFWSALESRQDELAANAAAFLAGMLGNEGLGEKERRWERMGMALLVRMGPGHDLTRSWLLQGRGNLAQRERRLEDARAAFVEAVALKTRVLGPDHPDVALSVDALGQVLEEIGDREGALAQSQRALAIMERAYGKDSPLLAYMMSNRGEVLNSLGRPGEALPVFRRSLELSRPAIDAVWNAYPLTGIGQAFLLLGRPGEAVPPLERALLLREKGDRICQSIGETRFALARALAAGGDSKEAARARLIGVAARDDYATCAGHAGEHAAVVRWLDGLLARR